MTLTQSAPWPRTTVARAKTIAGPSLATGAAVTVTVSPAEAKTGILFRHLPTGADIPADLAHTAEVPNCTSLRAGEARVDFVEHLMAALWAQRITDAIIEVGGGEVPLLDGSAEPYLTMIREAGERRLEGEVRAIEVSDRAFYHFRDGRVILARPGRGYSYALEHEHPLIGRQYASYLPDSDSFARDLACARTFATEQETRALLAARGLKGAQPEMAIIVYEDRLSEPEPTKDSFARHKIVDMIGDLYLLGRPFGADVVACRTGHADNRALARQIAEAYGLL